MSSEDLEKVDNVGTITADEVGLVVEELEIGFRGILVDDPGLLAVVFVVDVGVFAVVVVVGMMAAVLNDVVSVVVGKVGRGGMTKVDAHSTSIPEAGEPLRYVTGIEKHMCLNLRRLIQAKCCLTINRLHSFILLSI